MKSLLTLTLTICWLTSTGLAQGTHIQSPAEYIVTSHDPIKGLSLHPHSFEIYQNHTKTKISLILDDVQTNEFKKATIRTTNGFPLITSHSNEAIDVSALEKGFYYVFVEYGNNQVSVQKLIKG